MSINLEDYVIHCPVAIIFFDGNGGQFAAVFGFVNLSELNRWERTLGGRVEVRSENWKV